MPARCRLLVLCVTTVATVLSAAAFEVPITARMAASTAWAENISHTSSAADRKSAVRDQLSGGASWLHEWPGSFVSVLDVSATAETIRHYSKAGSMTVGPTFSVRRKFGLGAFAPLAEATIGAAYRDARLAYDDGWSPTASLRVAKRISGAWRVALTTDWAQHDGKNATFDTSHHRVFAQLAWDPTPRLQISYGVGRLWGSFTANASAPVWTRALGGALGAKVFEYYNTVPWLTTEMYGPRWVTYRVEGFANFQWLEISPALGRNTSLPFRLERTNTINLIGVAYPQEIWSLSVLHRF